MFLRQSSVGREPLAIAMSGVRMGERVLQIGMDTPAVTSLLAAKPGLSGESSIVVADDATAARARRAVAETNALVNIGVHALDALPLVSGFGRPDRRSQPGWPESAGQSEHASPRGVPPHPSIGRPSRRSGERDSDWTRGNFSVADRAGR